MELTTCPECGELATIAERHVLESTDAPVEHGSRVSTARAASSTP